MKYIGERDVTLSRKELLLILDALNRQGSALRTAVKYVDLAESLQASGEAKERCRTNAEAAAELVPMVDALRRRLVDEANREKEGEE